MTSDSEKGTTTAVHSLDGDRPSREMEPDEAAQPPRKRSKYVEKACNRCKKKKIRCNGQMPCNQCETRGRRDCGYGSPRAHYANNWPSDIHQYPSGWSPSAGVISTMPPDLTDLSQLLALPKVVQGQSERLNAFLERLSAIEMALGRSSVANSDINVTVPGSTDVGRQEMLRMPVQAEPSSPFNRPLPLFKGATSPSLYIKIVEMSLEEVESPQIEREAECASSAGDSCVSFDMHVAEIIQDGHNDTDETELVDPYLQRSEISPTQALSSSLEDIRWDEARRLVTVFDEMVNSMYPIVNAEDVMRTVDWLYSGGNGNANGRDTDILSVGTSPLVDESDIKILKMVLATALVAEGSKDNNPVSLKLYQSAHDEVEMKIWSSETDLKGLMLLTLVSLCHMFRDNWRLAWRIVGNLLRVLLELRLNQYRVLCKSFPRREDQIMAINIIWSIILLDRQLCPALGLPVAAHEGFLDPKFPEPINSPYLKLILDYSRIGMQVCDSMPRDILSFKAGQTPGSQDLPGFLMYQLEEWQKRLPVDLQFQVEDSNELARSRRLLRTTLYLRRNHLKILIVRPSLCSHTWSNVNTKLWTTAVDAACDNIQVLLYLNETSDMYHFHQTLFNYFFSTALGILMLRICRTALETRLSSHSSIAPDFQNLGDAEQLSTYENARHGILVVLGLLRTLLASPHSSNLSRRLWSKWLNLGYRIHLLDMLSTSTGFPALDQEINMLNGSSAGTDGVLNNEANQSSGPWSKPKNVSDYDFGPFAEILGLGLDSPGGGGFHF